jgi:hypothetical protein
VVGAVAEFLLGDLPAGDLVRGDGDGVADGDDLLADPLVGAVGATQLHLLDHRLARAHRRCPERHEPGGPLREELADGSSDRILGLDAGHPGGSCVGEPHPEVHDLADAVGLGGQDRQGVERGAGSPEHEVPHEVVVARRRQW